MPEPPNESIPALRQTISNENSLRRRVQESMRSLAVAIHLVPVGTLITERPPERSVQAHLRIRILRRISGVEASFGIGMQDAGRWDPSVEDRAIFRPPLSRSLTAANQNAMPQSIDASSEDAQLIDVTGHSMVLVIADDHLPKPYTNLTSAIMLPALKLSLDGFQLRNHALFRSDSPDGVCLGLVALPTVVDKPQEVEGLRFPCPTLLPVSGRIASELDQPGLIRV